MCITLDYCLCRKPPRNNVVMIWKRTTNYRMNFGMNFGVDLVWILAWIFSPWNLVVWIFPPWFYSLGYASLCLRVVWIFGRKIHTTSTAFFIHTSFFLIDLKTQGARTFFTQTIGISRAHRERGHSPRKMARIWSIRAFNGPVAVAANRLRTL